MTAAAWFRRRWDEGRGDGDDGWGASTWYFETDPVDHVLRQVEIYDAGPTRRYDDGHPDDVYGGLSQVDLEPAEWADFTIGAGEFTAAWEGQPRRKP